MMLILGIVNNDVSGACLIQDSTVLYAVHEERFTRKKNESCWPQKSIDFVLKSHDVTLDQVDYITYGWSTGFAPDQHLDLYFERIARTTPDQLPFIRDRVIAEINNDEFKRLEFQEFIDMYNLQDKVIYIDHHKSHGFGAYLCSPFKKALVVTCDGRGDFQSLTVCKATMNSYVTLHRETSIDSLGYFYGRITKLLGFKPNQHEGKVTGLAAFGDKTKYLDLMNEMICYDNGRLTASCGKLFEPSYNSYSVELLDIIKSASAADIAAAAQHHLENLMVQIVEKYVASTGLSSICLSGGVFGNVRLNQLIREIAGVDAVYVLPCMGDGGHPLSSAAVGMYDIAKIRVKTPPMSLGPEYSDKEIMQLIMNSYSEIYVEESPSAISEVINELSQNKIVGLFRGKMEFGPRALCKRSIIYHTKDKTMNDWLN